MLVKIRTNALHGHLEHAIMMRQVNMSTTLLAKCTVFKEQCPMSGHVVLPKALRGMTSAVWVHCFGPAQQTCCPAAESTKSCWIIFSKRKRLDSPTQLMKTKHQNYKVHRGSHIKLFLEKLRGLFFFYVQLAVKSKAPGN